MTTKSKITDRICNIAYVRAYKESIDFNRLFDCPEIEKLFLHEALSKNTKPEFIFGTLLPATSILMAPATRLKITENSNDYTLRPNIYLICVGISGSGKSPAFNQYLLEPLKAIATSKKLNKFVFQQFSKCGVIDILAKNDGRLLWASDECGEPLTKCFGGTGEWEEFRGMLNNFYSGYGYSKNTAGKGAVEIDSTYFSMVGFTQPQPFCHVLEKLGATKDGLQDRFLTLSAPAYIEGTLDSITWPDFVLNRPKDWALVALSFIYDEHSANGAIEYKLSSEALEELKAFRNIEREDTVSKFKEAEEALIEQNQPISSASISEDHASSKDIDNGLRLAVLIHVMKHSLLRALRMHDSPIPKEISGDTFLRAFELVTILKKQMCSYKIAVFEDDSKLPTLDESRHGVIFDKQTPDLRNLIVEYPGPFVTARMLTRRKRMPALSCATTLTSLGSLPEADGNYMGSYKRLKISGKATHCFVKAKPDQISDTLLGDLNITREMYKTVYDKDITTTAPNTGICPDWPKYYSDVKAAIAQNDDEPEF